MGIKSKLTKSQRVLKKYLIANKKQIFKRMFKYHANWGCYIGKYNNEKEVNPNRTMQALKIRWALLDWAEEEYDSSPYTAYNTYVLAPWFWAKYWKEYFVPKIEYGKLPTPHMDKTKAIEEFIARGFVHMDSFTYNIYEDYVNKCTIAPLIYPKAFTQHQDAIKFGSKWGIPGYTESPVLKEKK